MSAVKIRQFGGHIGSFAGDCGVVTIDTLGHREVLVIDTGSTKAWGTKTELTKYVNSQLATFGQRTVTLVTTHFHEDHYNPANIPSLKVDRHVFPKGAAQNVGQEDFYGEPIALAPGVHELRGEDTGCVVRFYVPPGGKEDDQNDQSMAIYVNCPQFSFLSFGDMTRDAYLRLVESVGPLPRASTTKYPHHGNHPANYLDYYYENLFSTAVLISGNSGSSVDKTITSLLKHNVGAVYCLARTDQAREQFELSWKTTDQPVYICRDAVLMQGGVSIEKGSYFTNVEEQVTSRRRTNRDQWVGVTQDWSEVDSDDEMVS